MDTGLLILYIFFAVLQVYIYFSLGVLSYYRKIYNMYTVKKLSSILYGVFMPVYAFVEISHVASAENIKLYFMLFISTICCIGVGYSLGKLFNKTFSLEERIKECFSLTCAFPALGSFPLVIAQLLCTTGGPLAGISTCSNVTGLMIFNFFIYCIALFIMGFMLVTGDKSLNDEVKFQLQILWHTLNKTFQIKDYYILNLCDKFIKKKDFAISVYENFTESFKFHVDENYYHSLTVDTEKLDGKKIKFLNENFFEQEKVKMKDPVKNIKNDENPLMTEMKIINDKKDSSHLPVIEHNNQENQNLKVKEEIKNNDPYENYFDNSLNKSKDLEKNKEKIIEDKPVDYLEKEKIVLNKLKESFKNAVRRESFKNAGASSSFKHMGIESFKVINNKESFKVVAPRESFKAEKMESFKAAMKNSFKMQNPRESFKNTVNNQKDDGQQFNHKNIEDIKYIEEMDESKEKNEDNIEVPEEIVNDVVQEIRRNEEKDYFKNRIDIISYYTALFDTVESHLDKEMGLEFEKERTSVMAKLRENICIFPIIEGVAISEKRLEIVQNEWKKYQKFLDIRQVSIENYPEKISVKLSMVLSQLISPPIFGCFVGLIFGIGGMAHDVLFSSNHYITNIYNVLTICYKAYIPILFLSTGVSIVGCKGLSLNMPFNRKNLIFTFIVKAILVPLIGLGFVTLITKFYGGVFDTDRVLRFSLFIPWCLPASPNFTLVVNLLGFFKDELGYVLMWHNIFVMLTMTVWLIIYFSVIG